jgi:hypothetical protein
MKFEHIYNQENFWFPKRGVFMTAGQADFEGARGASMSSPSESGKGVESIMPPLTGKRLEKAAAILNFDFSPAQLSHGDHIRQLEIRETDLKAHAIYLRATLKMYAGGDNIPQLKSHRRQVRKIEGKLADVKDQLLLAREVMNNKKALTAQQRQ